MMDTPEHVEIGRQAWLCMRCSKPIPIAEPQRYVYCSWECQQFDVPTEPGHGGVRS